MAIRVECKCGKVSTAPDEYAGREVICPGCRAQITLPGMPSTFIPPTSLPVAPPEPQPEKPKPIPPTYEQRMEKLAVEMSGKLGAINQGVGCILWFLIVVAVLVFLGVVSVESNSHR